MPSPEAPICCRSELGYITTFSWKRVRSRRVGNRLGWNHQMVNASLSRDPVLVSWETLQGPELQALGWDGMGWDMSESERPMCLNLRACPPPPPSTWFFMGTIWCGDQNFAKQRLTYLGAWAQRGWIRGKITRANSNSLTISTAHNP